MPAVDSLLAFLIPSPTFLLVALTLAIFAAAGIFGAHEVERRRARTGLPGPKGLPFFGNLWQIKGKPAFEQYRLWATEFGPVFEVQLGVMTSVIINDAECARELLINRHSALISRPVLYTFHRSVNTLKGAEEDDGLAFATFSIGTSPWDQSCKRRRRAAATALNIPAVKSYAPILDFETKEFCRDLLEECDGGKKAVYLKPLLYHLSLNMSLNLNYGTRILTHESPLFKEIYYVEAQISRLRSTSENLGDFFPVLRWNPFSKSGKEARDIGNRRKAYNYKLLAELADRVKTGTDRPCIQGNVEKDADAKLTREERLGISMSIVAGADSSTPTFGWITAFLMNNPAWQSRLYTTLIAEQERLGGAFEPAHDDPIPLFDAFIREIIRFYPPLRTGIPRAAYVDTEYNGAVIKKGTQVLFNIWACNRDPRIFDQPERFDPERWLDEKNKQNPAHQLFSFGLGARNCPASFLTYRILYLTLVRLVTHFVVLPDPSPDGRTPSPDPIEGVSSFAALGTAPDDFKVVFKPRDRKALEEWLGEKPTSFGGLASQ